MVETIYNTYTIWSQQETVSNKITLNNTLCTAPAEHQIMDIKSSQELVEEKNTEFKRIDEATFSCSFVSRTHQQQSVLRIWLGSFTSDGLLHARGICESYWN